MRLLRGYWMNRAGLEMAQVRCADPLDAMCVGALIVVLLCCDQMDKRKNWRSLRRAAPSDLPRQRDTSEPPRLHRHTCEARHIRRVRFPSFPFPFHLNFCHSDNRATGVAFTFNPLFHPDGPTETRTVRGTKLVVLCAGSFGTPGILERSGIGSKAILEGVGVKQRVDLPGVGENYQGLSLLRDSCRGPSMFLTSGRDPCRSQYRVRSVFLCR